MVCRPRKANIRFRLKQKNGSFPFSANIQVAVFC
jgi:hypothetical protein